MGDIGPVKKEIILEPFPEHAPSEPTTVPSTPVPVPDREPEKVPA